MVEIDYLLIGIVVLSAVMGVFRGFVKEAMSLLGWIVAVWGAWRYGTDVANALPDFIDDPVLKLWAARLLMLIGTLFVTGVISRIIGILLDSTGLSGTNRLIGLVFGLARGVVVVGIVVSLLKVAGFDADPWWRESKLIPYAAPIADRLSEYAEDGIEMLDFPPVPSDAEKFLPKD